jgi:hypothetical protein
VSLSFYRRIQSYCTVNLSAKEGKPLQQFKVESDRRRLLTSSAWKPKNIDETIIEIHRTSSSLTVEKLSHSSWEGAEKEGTEKYGELFKSSRVEPIFNLVSSLNIHFGRGGGQKLFLLGFLNLIITL